MHGMSPDEEIDYWRERANKAEVERDDARTACQKWQSYFTNTPGLAAANAEIVSLRAQLVMVRKQADDALALHDEVEAERDQLRAECERLKTIASIAARVVKENRASIMHARASRAMCDLERAISSALTPSDGSGT